MAKVKKQEKTLDKDSCRMITPEFRVSYPHVFKAHSPKEGDKPKFSVTMLFPKDSDLMGNYIASYDEDSGQPNLKPRGLKTLIKNAKIVEFGSLDDAPDDLESPVTDGDDPKHADKEGYAGHWVIKASTSEDQRPGVVDENGKPITGEDASKFYPGCWARAYIYAYVYFYPNRQKPMKKGVSFILDHVQKLRDDKAFGGKKPVDQVFGPAPGRDEDEEGEESASDFR